MTLFFILLPIGIFAISTASIFIKLCEAPALIIATYRMMLASFMLMPFACYKKTWRGWERNEMGWFLLSGLFLSLHFAFWIASLKYTSVASSVVLVTTHPIFVGIGGWIFLREQTPPDPWGLSRALERTIAEIRQNLSPGSFGEPVRTGVSIFSALPSKSPFPQGVHRCGWVFPCP